MPKIIVQKIIPGFVVQNYEYDTEAGKGVCSSQEFVAGDQVEIEDGQGNLLDNIQDENLEYQVFDMIQPETHIKNGFFVSNFDDGSVIVSPAKLNIKTGEITDIVAVDVDPSGMLENETFEDKNGNVFEVCMECHEYIRKTVMEEGEGKSLEEVKKCSGGCNNA